VNATYFRPPTNRKEKKLHPPPPEFTSINTPLPPEKKIIKIISFIETPNPNLNEIKSLALIIYSMWPKVLQHVKKSL